MAEHKNALDETSANREEITLIKFKIDHEETHLYDEEIFFNDEEVLLVQKIMDKYRAELINIAKIKTDEEDNYLYFNSSSPS